MLGVDSDEWRGIAFVHVATKTAVGGDSAADEVSWSRMSASADVGESEAEIVTGEVGAFRILKRWGTRAKIGSPFGPSFGLEDAQREVRPFIEEPTDIRLWGEGLALALGREHQAGVLNFNNWDDVMGCTSRAFAKYGLTESQGIACYEALTDAKRVVIEMIERSGPSFEKWTRDDGFALCAYVTQQVAYFRLGALGLIDIIDL